GTDIAVMGPMARSAADLEVALGVLAGPDPDETGMTVTLPAPRFSGLRDLRVAVWAEQPGQATDGEITEHLLALADRLERLGATVSRTARPAFDPTEAYHLYLRLLDAAWSWRLSEETLAAQRARKAAMGDGALSADDIMARMVDVPHRLWLGMNEKRFRWRRLWSAFFREWDVLLCPAIATAALPHRQDGATHERRVVVGGQEIAYNDMLFWPGLTCGYHLPATVVPLGLTQAGLPVGVQIAGPLHGDRVTIAAASLLEQEGFGFRPPPGW
ncbi:MAG TPA: amidase family protein, partial [Rhodopila sp.]|nr:amidase family protein [Rhodopila sp.]